MTAMKLNLENRDNLYFHPDTPQAVSKAIALLVGSTRKARIWLGDPITGRAWAEENDVFGRIGNSTGPTKVPLLVEDGEIGGDAFSCHRIVRIDEVSRHALRADETRADGRSAKSVLRGITLYQHPSFHTGDWRITPADIAGYAEAALLDGEVHARFKKAGKAARYVDFMQGQAYTF